MYDKGLSWATNFSSPTPQYNRKPAKFISIQGDNGIAINAVSSECIQGYAGNPSCRVLWPTPQLVSQMISAYLKWESLALQSSLMFAFRIKIMICFFEREMDSPISIKGSAPFTGDDVVGVNE